MFSSLPYDGFTVVQAFCLVGVLPLVCLRLASGTQTRRTGMTSVFVNRINPNDVGLMLMHQDGGTNGEMTAGREIAGDWIATVRFSQSVDAQPQSSGSPGLTAVYGSCRTLS